MTPLEMDVSATDLLRRCSILHHSSKKHLDAWLAHSPLHFFVRYSSQSLKPDNWNRLVELSRKKVPVCQACFQEDEVQVQLQKAFARQQPHPCLRTFDPFAGVGAFGLAMEETGFVKVTHAIEISPSAAETMRCGLLFPVCLFPKLLLSPQSPIEKIARTPPFITNAPTLSFVTRSSLTRDNGRVHHRWTSRKRPLSLPLRHRKR